MEYKVETSLRNFKAWEGGKYTLEKLIERGDCKDVELNIENLFDETPTDTEINDYLWFNRDEIANDLGYEDWDMYEAGVSKKDEKEADDWWHDLEDDDRLRLSGKDDTEDAEDWWDELNPKEKYDFYERQ